MSKLVFYFQLFGQEAHRLLEELHFLFFEFGQLIYNCNEVHFAVPAVWVENYEGIVASIFEN